MLRFILLMGCVLWSWQTFAEDPADISTDVAKASEKLQTDVETLVKNAIAEGKLPGAVVLIGVDEQVILHQAYGHRQLLPDKMEMTCDTVFDLASLTKPIATATSMMLLIDQQKVTLQDPVAEHLPEFAVHGKNAVTIEQLLLHTGGLIPDNPMSDYRGTPQESIANLMDLELNYPPGSRFRYSDVGFQVLGELVRRCTGEDLNEFSRKHIFVPLGMTETTYRPGPELVRRTAPTEKRAGSWIRGEVHDPRAFALGGVAGHAGLFSTSSDLAIYARMILGQGTLGDVQILQPETVKKMNSPYPVPGGIRGLGWDKQTGYSSNRGKTMSASALGHGGFTGTAIWIDPELNLYVIFLSNRVHPSGEGSVNSLAGEIGTLAADFARGLMKEADSSDEPPAAMPNK